MSERLNVHTLPNAPEGMLFGELQAWDSMVAEILRAQASEDILNLALMHAQDQAKEQMERVHALDECVRGMKEREWIAQNNYDELMRSYCNLRDRLLRLRDLSFPCPHCGKGRFQKLADDHVLTGGKEE